MLIAIRLECAYNYSKLQSNIERNLKCLRYSVSFEINCRVAPRLKFFEQQSWPAPLPMEGEISDLETRLERNLAIRKSISPATKRSIVHRTSPYDQK